MKKGRRFVHPLPLSESFRKKRISGLRNHAHPGLGFPLPGVLFELDFPVRLGKQGVVPAHTHIRPGMDLGPQLPDQYVAGPDLLTAETFDAPPLTNTVPAVP